MRNAPLISVIVPVWNAEKYLESCLESILKQTFTDLEVVVVDDGSTDDSGRIVDGYALEDSRVCRISQSHRGDGMARNIGVSQSRGSYIFFTDADDIVHPRALEILYRVLVQYRADVVVGDYRRVPEDFQALPDDLVGSGSQRQEALVLGPSSSLRHMVAGRLRNAVWGTLTRRRIFNQVVFPDVFSAADLVFTAHAFVASRKTVVISDVLYYYRQNPHSIMHTVNESRLYTIEGMKHLVRLVDSTVPTWRLRGAVRGRLLKAASGTARFYATGGNRTRNWTALFFSRFPRREIAILCLNPMISLRSRVIGLSLLPGLRIHEYLYRIGQRMVKNL